MMKVTKVGLQERLLVEDGINRYKLLGPGLAWLAPWQRERARLYVGPNAVSVDCDRVRVSEDIPVNVLVKVIYRVTPDLLTEKLLPRVPGLVDGGWRNIVHWRTEAVVRRLFGRYHWRDLKTEPAQVELEQQISQALVERLAMLALEVMAVTLVKTELDARLQKTIVGAAQDGIEAGGRAEVLKQYFDLFGDRLSQVMPYIVQWELLNTLHKKGNPQLLLAASGLSLGPALPASKTGGPVYQMRLPQFTGPEEADAGR